MNDQNPTPTPPPVPENDEAWAKKLGLDYDAEKVSQTTPPPVPGSEMPDNVPDQPAAPSNNPVPEIKSAEGMPDTYLLWSILAAVFCCLPAAIVAIIFSAQVSSKFYAGDYEGAKKSSERAQMWIIASIVLGVITMALYLPLMLLSPQ